MTMNLINEILLASPEVWLAGMLVLVLLVDLFVKQKHHGITYGLSVVAMIGGFVLSLSQYRHHLAVTIFDQLYVLDHITLVAKLALWILGFAVFVYSRTYFSQRQIFQGEFYLLMMCALLGALVLVSANALLTIYLGVELLSLPIYALIAIRRDCLVGPEAAMKYFIMGAASSGLLLFGMTLVYAVCHSLYLPVITTYLQQEGAMIAPLAMGFLLMVLAVAFKFGAVPFHMWAPDVYEGAPTPVVAFVSTVPKVAALLMLTHLVIHSFAGGNLHPAITMVLLAVSVLSILIGNIVAVVQSNIKRLFAYSTIANIGFVLLALSYGQEGVSVALFYTLVYVVMSMGALGALTLLSQHGVDIDKVEDLKGLGKRNPFIALMLMLLLFSMAGVPPFVGFLAKLRVIMLLVDHQAYALATFALVMSVVGAYYALRVIKVMYFEQSDNTQTLSAPLTGSVSAWGGNGLLLINGLAMLVLGIMPVWLLQVL